MSEMDKIYDEANTGGPNCCCGQYSAKLKEAFGKLHTKGLLKALDDFRVFNQCQKDPEDPYASEPWVPYFQDGMLWSSANYHGEVKGGMLYLDMFPEWPDAPLVSEAMLKAELATREHVPNKAEAKEMRQQKAKQQRNR